MKHLIVILVLSSALLAQCPLGYTPAEACNVANPSCLLFFDGNGDGLCDNPGPQPTENPDEVIDPNPDTEPEVTVEPEVVIDSIPDTEPEVTVEPEEIIDPFCPFGLTPPEACEQATARCALYTDANGDGRCDNPGPQPVQEVEQQEETSGEQPTEEEPETPIIEEETTEPQIGETAADSLESVVDTVAAVQYTCPLGFTVEQACYEESPLCTLYTDANGDGRCDNPGTVCAVLDTLCGLDVPSIIGCPLGIPPERACPDSLALCPHWYGVTYNTVCSNPAGGQRRINILLLTLGILLPVSTWLSRRFYGRALKDRLRRNSAHHVVRGVSLMILGFGVQGCFCPLGTFQYVFTANGIAFLGLSGLLIFLLPLVFSAFFGRVFCGWVCPMGAVQEFLFGIHAPGRFSPRGKFHRKLRYLSYVILFAIIALILLNRFAVVSLPWPAPFCTIDPFHTMFTLFLSGSLVISGITIVLSIYIRRFFCRYLCFYGAALAIFSRLTLWNRIKGVRETQPEIDSDEEFDK
jgi:hypothetical protein